jgi:DNA (cytosine-5)-methyltransferase 1
MKTKKKLKVLDLFAGVGGLSYGFEKAGFEIVGALEYEKSIAESMRKNHKNTKVFIDDIKNFKPEKAKKIIGKIDVIVGGPPCQGFSLKGQRGGLKDERNFLFREFINFVKYFKPKYFLIENVPTILTDQNSFFKKQIIKEFEKLNYNVVSGIIKASDFGVPQNRRRALFLGSYKNSISFPKPVKRKTVTVWEAISDLAYLNSGDGEFEADYLNKAETDYQKKMRKNSKKLYNHISTKHSPVAIERLKLIPPEKGKEYIIDKYNITSTFGQTWSRLEKNKPSPTIVTRFDTPSNGRNSHPFLHRAITPREAARIQSFPDTFIFHGNKSSIIKQIGNAVPPLMAEAIAKHILNNYEKNK